MNHVAKTCQKNCEALLLQETGKHFYSQVNTLDASRNLLLSKFFRDFLTRIIRRYVKLEKSQFKTQHDPALMSCGLPTCEKRFRRLHSIFSPDPTAAPTVPDIHERFFRFCYFKFSWPVALSELRKLDEKTEIQIYTPASCCPGR
jgi:hypothetical protein